MTIEAVPRSRCPRPNISAHAYLLNEGPPEVYTGEASLEECEFQYAACPLSEFVVQASGRTVREAKNNAKALVRPPRAACLGPEVIKRS